MGFVFVLPASPDGEQAVASRPNTRGSFQGLKRELGDAKPAGGELLAPQEFRGIDAVINEATSCARLFAGEPSVEFALSEDDVIMSGDKLMCRWELLLHELKAPGMLYATFTPQNKLLSAEMVFDSLAIAKQLQQRHSLRATGGVAPPQKSAVQSAEVRRREGGAGEAGQRARARIALETRDGRRPRRGRRRGRRARDDGRADERDLERALGRAHRRPAER